MTPESRPTREALLRLNACAGTYHHAEPVLLEDSDGVPLGVAESDVQFVYNAGAIVSLAHVTAAGLLPADIPRLSIYDTAHRRVIQRGKIHD